MRRLHVPLLFLSLPMVCMAAIDPSNYERSKSDLHSDFTVFWKIAGDTFHLGLQAKATGWVGFGIAEAGGMKGADIVYFESEGSKLVDAHALDYVQPVPDQCNDWTLVDSSVEDGTIYVEATRALDTKDLQDWKIFDDSKFSIGNRVIAAWGDQTSISYHNSNRASGALHFFGSEEPPNPLTWAQQNVANLKSVEWKHDGFNIPERKTTYKKDCVDMAELLDVEPGVKHYLIAIEAVVDPNTKANLHHFVAYGYYSAQTQADPEGTRCAFTQAGDNTISFSWAPGVPAMVFPSGTGVPLLGDSGFRSFLIDTHYDNPLGLDDLVDNSGVRFWYTTEPQTHDVSVLQIGDPQVALGYLDRSLAELPAGQSKFTFSCRRITLNFEDDQVTVFARFLHMHAVGARMVVRQYSQAGKLLRSDGIEVYDFEQSGGHNPISVMDGFKLSRGDYFEIECFYDVSGGGRVWGLGSEDEMCMDFLFFYPAQPLPASGSCSIEVDGDQGAMAAIGASFHGWEESPHYERTFGVGCEGDGFSGSLPFETESHCAGVSACVTALGSKPTECGGSEGVEGMLLGLEQCFQEHECCEEWSYAVSLWQGAGLGECDWEVLPSDAKCPTPEVKSMGNYICPSAVACLAELEEPTACDDASQEWASAAAGCFEEAGCCEWLLPALDAYRVSRGWDIGCQAIFAGAGECQGGGDGDEVECFGWAYYIEGTNGCPGFGDCIRTDVCEENGFQDIGAVIFGDASCGKLRAAEACARESGCCSFWESDFAPFVASNPLLSSCVAEGGAGCAGHACWGWAPETEATWGCEGFAECIQTEFCAGRDALPALGDCTPAQQAQACYFKTGCCAAWNSEGEPHWMREDAAQSGVDCAGKMSDGERVCAADACRAANPDVPFEAGCPCLGTCLDRVSAMAGYDWVDGRCEGEVLRGAGVNLCLAKEARSYEECKATCAAQGMRMPCPADQAAMAAMAAAYTGGEALETGFWVGATQAAGSSAVTEGWAYPAGCDSSYEGWSPGEPNDCDESGCGGEETGGEDCAVAFAGGAWADMSCEAEMRCVCETETSCSDFEALLPAARACFEESGCCARWDSAMTLLATLDPGLAACNTGPQPLCSPYEDACGDGIAACLDQTELPGSCEEMTAAQASALAKCFEARACCAAWDDAVAFWGEEFGLSGAGCAFGSCADLQRETAAFDLVLPLSEAEFTAARQTALRQATADTFQVPLSWATIKSFSAVASSASRRLLADSLRVDMEVEMPAGSTQPEIDAALGGLNVNLNAHGLPSAEEVGSGTITTGTGEGSRRAWSGVGWALGVALSLALWRVGGV